MPATINQYEAESETPYISDPKDFSEKILKIIETNPDLMNTISTLTLHYVPGQKIEPGQVKLKVSLYERLVLLFCACYYESHSTETEELYLQQFEHSDPKPKEYDTSKFKTELGFTAKVLKELKIYKYEIGPNAQSYVNLYLDPVKSDKTESDETIKSVKDDLYKPVKEAGGRRKKSFSRRKPQRKTRNKRR